MAQRKTARQQRMKNKASLPQEPMPKNVNELDQHTKASSDTDRGNSHNPEGSAFDLERFERLVYSRYAPEVETAFEMLHGLLRAMQLSRGDVPNGILCSRISSCLSEDDRLHALWTRVSAAILTLFLNPRFESLEAEGFQLLLRFKSQLVTVNQASIANTTDACIEAFNLTPNSTTFSVPTDDLYKVLLLYSLDSRYEPSLIYGFHDLDPEAVIDTCIALCSPSFCGTELAYRRRNEVLDYLCDKLRTFQLSERSLLDASAHVYMHCSYADRPNKHAIKKLIHQQWRQMLAQHGIKDLPNHKSTAKPGLKATVLILHEWLRTGHAMHRCYANWIDGLRQRFHTVGMGLKESTAMDPEAIALFDEYVALPEGVPTIDQVRVIHHWCQHNKPAIIYYPSLGMGVHTVAAASIRMAPVQILTPGHPSTSGSNVIDYMVVSEDHTHIAGLSQIDEQHIQEKVIYLPQGSMSWRRPPYNFAYHCGRSEPGNSALLDANKATQVVISASPMKLSHSFLGFLSAIHQECVGSVFWHFFLADTRGALHLEISARLRDYLGDAFIAYPALDYHDYLYRLEAGDLFLCPFPFGNANTIQDYLSLRMIGSCMQSNELQSPEAVLLSKVGFPRELIARDLPEYRELAVRLIIDYEWRKTMVSKVYCSAGSAPTLVDTGNSLSLSECFTTLR